MIPNMIGFVNWLMTMLRIFHMPLVYRVKSGNFGHQVNSDMHLQTVEIQMRRLLMSRLIRIFTVCLVNLIFIPIIKIWNKQGRCPNLADRPNLPDFTLSKNVLYADHWHIQVSQWTSCTSSAPLPPDNLRHLLWSTFNSMLTHISMRHFCGTLSISSDPDQTPRVSTVWLQSVPFKIE